MQGPIAGRLGIRYPIISAPMGMVAGRLAEAEEALSRLAR